MLVPDSATRLPPVGPTPRARNPHKVGLLQRRTLAVLAMKALIA
jgi:hypothetical protein